MGECRYGKKHSLICVKARSVSSDSTLEWCEVCGATVKTELILEGEDWTVVDRIEKIPQMTKEFLVVRADLAFTMTRGFSLNKEIKN